MEPKPSCCYSPLMKFNQLAFRLWCVNLLALVKKMPLTYSASGGTNSREILFVRGAATRLLENSLAIQLIQPCAYRIGRASTALPVRVGIDCCLRTWNQISQFLLSQSCFKQFGNYCFGIHRTFIITYVFANVNTFVLWLLYLCLLETPT